MTFRILVRTDVDWQHMTHSDFITQSDGINLPQQIIKDTNTLALIRAWEKATRLSYFLYRETLKRVCEAELRRIGEESGKDYRITRGVAVFLEDEGYHESDIILPIDDDDIFLNTVFSLEELFTRDYVNMVTWDRTTSVHGDERIENMRPYLDTCNWAIHGSYLKQFSEGMQFSILSKHQKAHAEIGKKLGIVDQIPGMIGVNFFKRPGSYVPLRHPTIIDLHQKHSVYFLHSGSISYLAHKMGKVEDIVTTIRNLPLHPLFDESIYQSLQGDTDDGNNTRR